MQGREAGEQKIEEEGRLNQRATEEGSTHAKEMNVGSSFLASPMKIRLTEAGWRGRGE